MPVRTLDPAAMGKMEDWEGNNAALTCPACPKVFIVSERIHKRRAEVPGVWPIHGPHRGRTQEWRHRQYCMVKNAEKPPPEANTSRVLTEKEKSRVE